MLLKCIAGLELDSVFILEEGLVFLFALVRKWACH